MVDSTAGLSVGRWTFPTTTRGLALVVHAPNEPDAPVDWLHELLLAPTHRADFFERVDHHGLVVVKDAGDREDGYRLVRGRSSRGRLSQGEYYHHDGCTGPVKPRVVEIRFPHQLVARQVATAVAPFPDTVVAMLAELPTALAQSPPWTSWRDRLATETLDRSAWDTLQGSLTRAVRRELGAVGARAYFRAVDARVGAYVEPWEAGESRFIANANPRRTMQHRRAWPLAMPEGTPNGNLVKRWPAEELDAAEPGAGAQAARPR